MRSVIKVIFLAFLPLAQSGHPKDAAKDSADELVDALARDLFHRVLQNLCHRAELDDTMLGKPRSLSVASHASLRPLPTRSARPKLTSGDSASPQVRYHPAGAHPHSIFDDSRLPLVGYHPQLHREAGWSQWAGCRPQVRRREVTGARHSQVSACGVFELGLAASTIKFDTTMQCLLKLPKVMFSAYNAQALEFPLRTKAMTSGFCYAIGDLCAQTIAGKNFSTLDLGRAARSGSAGFVGHGPVAHHWIDFLEKYLSFGGAWWAVFPKIIVNQPMNFVYNTIYSFIIGTLAFRHPRNIWKDVRAAAIPGFIASVRFWPFVNLITFGLIPLQLRVAWVDTVKIIWICILSHINNEGLDSMHAAEANTSSAAAENRSFAPAQAPGANSSAGR